MANRAASAPFCCGSRLLLCLCSFSFRKSLPISLRICWRGNHEGKDSPARCNRSPRSCRRFLFLRRPLNPQRATSAHEYLVRRSHVLEKRLQPLRIFGPRSAHAVSYLSGLLAGGLCNRTDAARHEWKECAGICRMGACIADRLLRPINGGTGAYS